MFRFSLYSVIMWLPGSTRLFLKIWTRPRWIFFMSAQTGRMPLTTSWSSWWEGDEETKKHWNRLNLEIEILTYYISKAFVDSLPQGHVQVQEEIWFHRFADLHRDGSRIVLIRWKHFIIYLSLLSRPIFLEMLFHNFCVSAETWILLQTLQTSREECFSPSFFFTGPER